MYCICRIFFWPNKFKNSCIVLKILHFGFHHLISTIPQCNREIRILKNFSPCPNLLYDFDFGSKIHNFFFPPTSNKFAVQNNRLMQLCLIFHKTLIKANWKSENFKVIDVIVFQQLRKLWKGEGTKFFCSFHYFCLYT